MFEKRSLKLSRARVAGATAGAALVAVAMLGGNATAWAIPSFPPKAPVPTLAFSPSGDFGQVTVGQTASTEFTLINTSVAASSSLTVTLAGSSEFSITSDTCTAISLGLNRTCTVTVQFAPAGAGSFSGTLTAAGMRPGVVTSVSLSGIGVSPYSPHLYWTTEGYSYFGRIMMANPNGTDPMQIAGGQNFQPGGIAVDGTHLYWDDTTAGTVVEANTDGSGAVVIETGQTPRQIAIDSVNGQIYWANYGTGVYGVGASLWKANLDGTDPVQIASFTGGQGVAVSGDQLYWTQGYDPYNPSQPYGIMEANLDGSGAHSIVNAQVFQLAADSTHLYWTGNNGVMEANLDGSGARLAGSGNIISGVAVSGSNLYWTDLNEGTVTMADLDGTSPVVIASGQEIPESVTVG